MSLLIRFVLILRDQILFFNVLLIPNIFQAIIAAVNFGKTSTVQSLADLPPFQKYSHAKTGQVIAINSNPHNYHLRETIDLSHMEIHLGPEEGIVFIVNA